MKEFKFKDIKGKEDSSTFYQYDLYEMNTNPFGFKDRWIFDFSGTNISGRWDNLSQLSDNATTTVGAPGSAQALISNVSSANTATFLQNIEKTLDVLGKNEVPVWNSNCLMYTDQHYAGSGGVFTTSNIKTFRAGYIEFTLKTDKDNCIIGFGSAEVSSTGSHPITTQNFNSVQMQTSEPTIIDGNYSYINEEFSHLNKIYINMKNGKLELRYVDEYGENKKEFSLIGNKTISDNQWHHVVINIGKPGTIREHGQKFNKRFIEFWVDGKLDLYTDEHINKEQLFFPTVEWLFMDPQIADKDDSVQDNGWNTYDYDGENDGFSYVGLREFNNIGNRRFNPRAIENAFKGSMNTFTAGINLSLSKFEIKERYRLWRGFNKNSADVFIATANIVQPTIVSNKKKALKLYWNNLINENAKNGIELDNEFDVKSYSVTHKTLNSVTEINNVDLASNKKLNKISDVRVAMTDNIFLWGPGKDLLLNRSEITMQSVAGRTTQTNPNNMKEYDSLLSGYNQLNVSPTYTPVVLDKVYTNLIFSGIALDNGDRVLLTNQINKKDNGIYIFNGLDKPLTRSKDAVSKDILNNAVVQIKDGYYKDTTWMQVNEMSSLGDYQIWNEIQKYPTEDTISSQPVFSSRWKDSYGVERFIDLQNDIAINDYDLIVFMNYPENNEQISENFINFTDNEIKQKYQSFIKSLTNVVAQGASLYVSSPRLAQDLGVVKTFTEVPQALGTSDPMSASLNPFEQNEPAERYFDTHRNLNYHIATEITGLTNKETYILTDFINYIPNNTYDYEQYHARYSYRQTGLKEGNEFIIPGLALRSITQNKNIPGFKNNQRGSKTMMAVAPSDILSGTVVTTFGNCYCEAGVIIDNPYDDYATTIVVHNNQLVNGQPINGKIFINCVEDGYTFSRKEYNKAVIQVLPSVDNNETVGTRAWQYSTTRLNRFPQRVTVAQLTEFGQTTPTNGGGGPFIQAQTNASNGIIRSQSDRNNIDYQSDLYPNESEEVYPLQEIPVLSMTYLGLLWLAE
jgi:hypothetical protein